jgi:hypothetical protein
MMKFLLALLEGIQEAKRYQAQRHIKGYRP